MEKAYGIDLGTTYSAISTLDQTGSPVIIEDAEMASPLLASAIYHTEDGRVIVGDSAKEEGALHPERLMQFFKRWIGLNDRPDRYHYIVDGKEYDPIELSSIVLGRIVNYAKESGEDVKHVVITCPAYFDYSQRDATKAAGEACGLDVMAIINEPTAAAISYCYNRFNEDQTVLVYDLGGGTFDVTLMRMTEKMGARNVEVIGTDGDAMLGGYDWDEVLFTILQNKYAEQYGDLPSEELKYEIRAKVEETKKKLSQRDSYTLKLVADGESIRLDVTREEFEAATTDLVQKTIGFLEAVLGKAGVSDDEIDVVLLVGGSTKMPMIKNLLTARFGDKVIFNDPDKAVAKGAAIIADAKLKGKVLDYLAALQEKIDKGEARVVQNNDGTTTVEITGGEETGEIALPTDIDIGGLIEGGIQVDGEGQIDIPSVVQTAAGVQEIKVEDVAPRTFGIIAAQPNSSGGLDLIVDHIVRKGEKTPCSYTRTYYTPRDNATILRFPVVQSVSEAEYDLIDVDRANDEYIFPDSTLEMKMCNELRLEVPSGLPKDSELEVAFSLDDLGNVTLTATEPKSGTTKTLTFRFSTTSQQELDEIKQNQAKRIYAAE